MSVVPVKLIRISFAATLNPRAGVLSSTGSLNKLLVRNGERGMARAAESYAEIAEHVPRVFRSQAIEQGGEADFQSWEGGAKKHS